MLFSGIRHDSSSPFNFTDKIIKHYKKLDIDPLSKTIIFSDSLDVDRAIEIKKYCQNKIKCSFGIGTNFTNSFNRSPPLNMVIKLWSINGFPVVKLSDVKGKENGDNKAIETMKWIVKNHLENKNEKK
jgi:nicotinate phosphoribosyltransferase